MMQVQHLPGTPAAASASERQAAALSRKSSSRISAKEGSLILEKYIHKLGSQEEDGEGESTRQIRTQ